MWELTILQLTHYGRAISFPDISSWQLLPPTICWLRRGLVSAQSLICHMQGNTIGELELSQDLAESKDKAFYCTCLGTEKNLE